MGDIWGDRLPGAVTLENTAQNKKGGSAQLPPNLTRSKEMSATVIFVKRSMQVKLILDGAG